MKTRLDVSKLTPEQQLSGYRAFGEAMRARKALEDARGTAKEVAARDAYNLAARTYHAIIEPVAPSGATGWR